MSTPGLALLLLLATLPLPGRAARVETLSARNSSEFPMARPAQAEVRLEPTSLVARTPQSERQVVLAHFESGGISGAVFRLARQDWAQPLEIRPQT